jgi:predicted pyridoxine 5'-phosphate oxidase superfamily flavin-nucleotide-binding protein
MAGRYLEVMFTPPVQAAQQSYYGRAQAVPAQPVRDPLGEDEVNFIKERDSFYMATVSPTGWPYLQHRGGEAGFLRVLDFSRLAFADYKGNRQMISTGHVAADGKVSLFLMDYPQRTRLKILGHAQVLDAREHPDLVESLADPAARRITERLYLIDVVSFDWNCPKYITPRYTAAEVEASVAGLRARIRELEARLAAGS